MLRYVRSSIGVYTRTFARKRVQAWEMVKRLELKTFCSLGLLPCSFPRSVTESQVSAIPKLWSEKKSEPKSPHVRQLIEGSAESVPKQQKLKLYNCGVPDLPRRGRRDNPIRNVQLESNKGHSLADISCLATRTPLWPSIGNLISWLPGCLKESGHEGYQ